MCHIHISIFSFRFHILELNFVREKRKKKGKETLNFIYNLETDDPPNPPNNGHQFTYVDNSINRDWDSRPLNSQFQVLGDPERAVHEYATPQPEEKPRPLVFCPCLPCPALFFSSFLPLPSPPFLLFPVSTPDRAENWTTTGGGKKEQMNRSRIESRCSSSWFTAVEFNPWRQITIVISNYNSVTGRARVDVHVENFKPRPPIFFPPPPLLFLSSPLSLSLFVVPLSLAFARKTNDDESWLASHRASNPFDDGSHVCWNVACLFRIVGIVFVPSSCVRRNKSAFDKNLFINRLIGTRILVERSMRKKSRRDVWRRQRRRRKLIESNLLSGSPILNHATSDRREFNYSRWKSSDQAASHPSTTPWLAIFRYIYSEVHTSLIRRSSEGCTGEKKVLAVQDGEKSRREGITISSTQKSPLEILLLSQLSFNAPPKT